MKRTKLLPLSVAATAVTAALLFVPQSCGARTPRTVKMKVGETIVLKPVPAAHLTSELPKAPPKKLLLKFMSGSKEVAASSNAVIRFYDASDAKDAYYTIRSEDFTALHLRTGCASSDVSLLDNAIESDVLICDGSLDVQRAIKIEVEFPGGKTKMATSVVPVSFEPDLFVGSVLFY